MAALITSDFVLPEQVSEGVWKKAQTTSALARLSGAKAQRFGKVNQMVLTAAPKAEIVGEGAEKSPTPTTYGNKVVTPIKLQVTVRCSDEVMWADEDYQMGILEDVRDNCAIALGRALDLVGIHKINPLTGQVSSLVPQGLTDATHSATINGNDYDAAVEAAAGLVIASGYNPTGIALDPTLSFGLATMRDATGHRLYPELGFGQNATAFEGMGAAVSNTLSAVEEMSPASNIAGIVGQFDAFRWGVQRSIGAKLIEYGDPDGLGDLQRMNQVAIRAEIVYGVGIMDLNAFAKVLK